MKKTVCDGSEVEWEPVLVQDYCEECGSRTGEYDTAEPEFHLPFEWRGPDVVCPRCGMKYGDYGKIAKLAVEKLAPKIAEQMEAQGPFFQHLKRWKQP